MEERRIPKIPFKYNSEDKRDEEGIQTG